MQVLPNVTGAAHGSPRPSLGAAEFSVADAERLAAAFKALADPVRLQLLSRLAAQAGGACVCDIQDVGVSQPTVSYHLKQLRLAGLVVRERRGSWVRYRVTPGVLLALARMLAPAVDATAGATERADSPMSTLVDIANWAFASIRRSTACGMYSAVSISRDIASYSGELSPSGVHTGTGRSPPPRISTSSMRRCGS